MQFELPGALGLPDARSLLRAAPDAPVSHVLVVATLGAPERRRLQRARRGRAVAPEPSPTPIATTRATVIEAAPVAADEARAWLAAADGRTAEQAFAQVVRAVQAQRIAAADAGLHPPALARALVVRAGYGAGEEVAEGRWTAARELPPPAAPHARRTNALRPQERLAALLGGRDHALACEELTLRARHDLDGGALREAALQLRVALEAALRELPASSSSPSLAARVAELAQQRPALDALADAALGGVLPPDAGETLGGVLGRLEAALRARVAGADR